ncbi:MAG: OmpA family protein [Elusimicrobia bacterium]|nr:OmpA family protein [Elusimicrobiota bacterium]
MARWEEREDEFENQLNRTSLWAITYGDLMSFLVLFFLLLYVGASTKSVAVQMSIKSVQEQFGKQGKAVGELFSRHGVQQIAKLETGEQKIRIVFSSPVLYDSGRAVLKPGSMGHLTQLAEALAEIPNPIQIEGHTDVQPLTPGSPFKSNWELSAARAFAVLTFFEGQGIPSSRLSAIGYGAGRPQKPNDTPEGRAANRRIEINIMRREE